MPELQRLNLKTARDQEGSIIVAAEQPLGLHRLEAWEMSQPRTMPLMTKQSNPIPRELLKRSVVDVIAVGVGQERRDDPFPARADALQPLRQRPGPQAQVEQNTYPFGLDQGRIPLRSARENRELNGHCGEKS
jgi:hypothetical protein